MTRTKTKPKTKAKTKPRTKTNPASALLVGQRHFGELSL